MANSNAKFKKYINLLDEVYNIKKALELKMINEDTKYSDYLAITCGFKNEKELIKNIEGIKKLNNK